MKKARLIKIVAIVVGAVLVVYTGLSIFGAHEAMEIPRLSLDEDVSPASVGLAYEDVSFNSREDNVMLRGWYLPAEGDCAIIIVHGGFQPRLDDEVDTLDLAHDLVAEGYNILLFDLRGRGESEGEGRALANIERDVGGAFDYIMSQGYPPERIYIIGFCSGAASACIFASQNQVGALVLDGCFANAYNMVVNQATQMGIPEFLVDSFTPGVFLMCRIFYSFKLVNAEDVVADVACPIFFIHEENDELISLEEMQLLFDLSTNPANQFWEVPDAEHSQSYKTHPDEYIERVDGFFSALD
jgi:pimeloyl-ACP methyl ester carboxylesterase